MGPSRHHLRLAARNVVDTFSSTAASSLITPRGVSDISKAKLQQLRYLRANGEVEVAQLGIISEDKTEEFNLREQALTLDGIKRKLNFCSKSLTMNNLYSGRGTHGNLTARKLRTKVKLEPDDDIPKEPRRSNSKLKLSAVRTETAGKGKVEYDATVKGKAKQQPQEKALSSPYQQHTEIDDIVKLEPREEAGPRRRKLQIDVLAEVKKVKLEEDHEKYSNKELHDNGKTTTQVLSRHTRKFSKHVSAGATPTEKASDRKRSSLVVEGTALGLEVVSLRPGSGVRLVSEEPSAITMLAGPYPSYARPLPEECQQAKDLLSALHGHLPEYERHQVSCPTSEGHIDVQPLQSLDSSCPETRDRRHVIKSAVEEIEKCVSMQVALTTRASSELGSRSDVLVPREHPRDRRAVLDSLIGTLLSQNTTDNNSRRAFASLKSAFPTWEEVLRADPEKVQDAIRCGGLAGIKAERIRTILDTLLKERGDISMEYIRSMSNEDIKMELSRFKGVGPKTVACVLMFHLHRKEFPVDTHVFRISKMLGWIPEQADREKAYLHLNQRIPDALKFEIHCLFVTHGKRCPKCAKRFNRQPSDGECPLLDWKSKWSSRRNAPLLK